MSFHELSASVVFASLFSGTIRCIGIYTLFLRVLTPKNNRIATGLFFLAGEYAFDIGYELMNAPYEGMVISFLLYYCALLPLLLLYLFKGSVLTRIGYGGLCLLFFFATELPTNLSLKLFPEEIQYIATHTYYFIADFSWEYFCVLGWLFYSWMVSLFVSHGFLSVFLTLRNRAELPRSARFMMIPLIQSIPAGLFVVLYHVPGAILEHAVLTPFLWALLFCIICDTALFFLLQRMDRQALQQEKLKLMAQEQQAIYDRCRATDSRYREERVFHHDLNNQVTTVRSLFQSGHQQEAMELLDTLCRRVSEYHSARSGGSLGCRSSAADARVRKGVSEFEKIFK